MRPRPLIAVITVFLLIYHSVPAGASMKDDLTLRLQMAGYRSDEIRDIVSGRKTLAAINTDIRRQLLGLEPAPRPPRRQPSGVMVAAKPYLTAVKNAAQRHRVSSALILAVIQAESAFCVSAVSHRGAVGLMQLMPETAETLGVTNPFDPWENISAGTRYLSYCLSRFGNTALALAAYNAGPERVSAHGGVPPLTETRQYIQRVLDYERYFRRHMGAM